MTDPCSWEDLRNRFLAALPGAELRPGGWLDVWRLVVEHPWYRAELTAWARRAVRAAGGPPQWREDVEQEAVLLLARKLRKAPGLGVDPERAEAHFAAWMGLIVRNDCRDAVRRLRRRSGRERPLPQQLPAREESAERQAEREARVDVSLAVGRLGEPQRTVLLLFSKGFAIGEIAERLGLSYWQAYRAYRDGLDRLRPRL